MSNDSHVSGNGDDAITKNELSELVPQLASDGITFEELSITVRVLEAVASLDPKNRKKSKGRSGHSNKKRSAGDVDGTSNSESTTPNHGEMKSKEDGITEGGEENNRLDDYRHSNLRPLRKALAKCHALHAQTMYGGQTQEEHLRQRGVERTLKRQKMAENVMQRRYVACTKLRRGRVERLNALKLDGADEERAKMERYMIPDGHVADESMSNRALMDAQEDCRNTAPKLMLGNGEDSNVENSDEQKSKKKDVDKVSTASDENSIPNGDSKDGHNPTGVELPKLRSCYVCKVRYRKLHHFYDQLCPDCALLNYSKRHQTAPLHNKIAIVTGCRVKIGYQTCLKLLRAGATVIGTTRFPNSAVAAYRTESDFEAWTDRLCIYGLDLRDVTGLEVFVRFLHTKYGSAGIDILINNACQTVRRPRDYYRPAVKKEMELWQNADDIHRSFLAHCVEYESVRSRLLLLNQSTGPNAENTARMLSQTSLSLHRDLTQTAPSLMLVENKGDNNEISTKPNNQQAGISMPLIKHNTALTNPSSTDGNVHSASTATSDVPTFERSGLSHSAAMSQMIVVSEDLGVPNDVLPHGISDVNGQQLDLRHTNSWLLKMEDVSTPEVMECMYINAIAPFVLNSRLKPLFAIIPPNMQKRPDRYIINVSAMEGKFYRYKMPNHPHTNMAKAALNMLTRTSSEDLAKQHGIYMNSVDTGWINDENPLERASKTAETNLFQTPIDEIDAAARILDPIFIGIKMDVEKEEKNGGKCDEENEKSLRLKDFGKFFKDYKETEW